MWQFMNPVKVVFGEGVLEQLPALLAGRSYGIVTYDTPWFAELVTQISRLCHKKPALVINNVQPNPDFDSLQQACQQWAQCDKRPELLIALGGGSVIDASKVIVAADGNFNRVRTALETGTPLPLDGSPQQTIAALLAIPTTAGTGSEVTQWATVWDSQNQRKYSLSHPALYPECALVDPELTLALPRALTISTALDALSHALESLWNRNNNPVSARFAISAARSILQHLPALAANPTDQSLRTHIARASLFAGVAFSNTRTALAHNLSYPITLQYGIAHGEACSFTLPDILASVLGEDPQLDHYLAEIFPGELWQAPAQLRQLLQTLNIPDHYQAYGITSSDWQTITDQAFAGERGQNFIGQKQRFIEISHR